MSCRVHSVRWEKIRSLFRRSLIGNLTELSLSILNKVALSTTMEEISERLIPLHVTAHFDFNFFCQDATLPDSVEKSTV